MSGVTNELFYSMIEIVLIISGPFTIQNANGETLENNSEPLRIGDYYVVTDASVEVNNERIHARSLSLGSTVSRHDSFTNLVRERDGGCVVTKLRNTYAPTGIWDAFEAAHIVPLAFYDDVWRAGNFGRWITGLTPRGGKINSPQNGLLIQRSLHTLFNHYRFSINPDDNNKIIFFQPDLWGISGTCLDPFHTEDRPSPELLRWHFRQAILTNMKGAGEPDFETDFPPGSDIMADIRSGPRAAERMEFELFGRLAAHMMEYEEMS